MSGRPLQTQRARGTPPNRWARHEAAFLAACPESRGLRPDLVIEIGDALLLCHFDIQVVQATLCSLKLFCGDLDPLLPGEFRQFNGSHTLLGLCQTLERLVDHCVIEAECDDMKIHGAFLCTGFCDGCELQRFGGCQHVYKIQTGVTRAMYR